MCKNASVGSVLPWNTRLLVAGSKETSAADSGLISKSTPWITFLNLPSVTVSSPINSPVWASDTTTFKAESLAFWI